MRPLKTSNGGSPLNCTIAWKLKRFRRSARSAGMVSPLPPQVNMLEAKQPHSCLPTGLPWEPGLCDLPGRVRAIDRDRVAGLEHDNSVRVIPRPRRSMRPDQMGA
jgi:hypothetical protein